VLINNSIRIYSLKLFNGAAIVYPLFFLKIYEGKAFSISHRFEGVASDSSVDLFFENPSGSNKNVFIMAIEVASSGLFWVDIFRGNSITTSGTSLSPVNLNTSSNNSSVVSAEYGGTYATGTLVHNTVAPGGTLVRAIGSIAEVGESIVLTPGNNLLIRGTNKAGASADMSIRVIWWEE